MGTQTAALPQALMAVREQDRADHDIRSLRRHLRSAGRQAIAAVGAEFRALRLRLALFWVETSHGKPPIKRAMHRLNDVERLVNQKIA